MVQNLREGMCASHTSPEPVKICKKCGAEKTLSEFYRDQSRSDGFQNKCKECQLAAKRKWRQDNPDRVAKQKRYKYPVTDEARARNRQWKEDNPDKVREHRRKYKEIYPERDDRTQSARAHKRRAAQRSSAWERGVTVEAFRERDGDQCVYCGVVMDFTAPRASRYRNLEHLVPVAKGGGHVFDNCFLACATCNREKGDRDPRTWLRLPGVP